MAAKTVEIKVVMEGLPDEAGEKQIASEIKAMLEKEYADGVKIFTSVAPGRIAAVAPSPLPSVRIEEAKDHDSKK